MPSAIRRDSGKPFQILKKKTHYKLRPVRLGLGEFGSACSNILHFIYGRLDRVFAARIHKVLHFRHRSVMIARSVFFSTRTKTLEGILNYSFQNKSADDKQNADLESFK